MILFSFCFRRRIIAALLPILCGLALPQMASAQKVYVGVADQWNDLIAHGDQWQYVRQNADGFYVNFIEMNWVLKGERGMNQGRLSETAALFAHKNAYLESDMNATPADDQQYIIHLQEAGFTIPYTSLNYGWSAPRAKNLATFENKAGKPRFNLVQTGPWGIGGDIVNSKEPGRVASNARYRAALAQCDGGSTDGPLGLWFNDTGAMRSGSVSIVKFARGLHKQAVVMLCPYPAKQKGYDPSMFLSVAQDCVHRHEDDAAIPDIWAVFEYATSIPPVPEQVDGKPVSTSTGVAYWLIHHIQDPEHAARLEAAPGQAKTGAAKSVAVYTLRNTSTWLDLCPVVRATLRAPGKNWTARYTLDGQDVTSAMTRGGGLACVANFRLQPGAARRLEVVLTRTKRGAPAAITLELMPHPSRLDRVHQKIVLHTASASQ